MEGEKAYYCDDCERLIPLSNVKGKGIPECCGRPMSLIPVGNCTKDPSSAEHARLKDDDGPCRLS